MRRSVLSVPPRSYGAVIPGREATSASTQVRDFPIASPLDLNHCSDFQPIPHHISCDDYLAMKEMVVATDTICFCGSDLRPYRSARREMDPRISIFRSINGRIRNLALTLKGRTTVARCRAGHRLLPQSPGARRVTDPLSGQAGARGRRRRTSSPPRSSLSSSSTCRRRSRHVAHDREAEAGARLVGVEPRAAGEQLGALSLGGCRARRPRPRSRTLSSLARGRR